MISYVVFIQLFLTGHPNLIFHKNEPLSKFVDFSVYTSVISFKLKSKSVFSDSSKLA